MEKTFIKKLRDKKTQEQAFTVLVEQYQERLYWVIRKIVLDHQDSDDVLQNTFIKIYKHIGKFQEKSSLYSWMYRIAINESLSFLKQRAKKQGISDKELLEQKLESLQTDVYFDGDAMQLLFQKAIASLPEKQKLVFNLKYFDKLSYQEISEILETSVGALKASYHHASKKIRTYIENQ